MLRIALTLSILTILFSGCSTDNSSALDAETYGGGSAVTSIFAQHCTPCHSFQSMTADQLVASGDIIKGDAANSPLYYRLTGSIGANGPKTMPQSPNSPLSATDVAAIQAYIAGLQ
jgi:mono/diheme cytochrome c family protein